MPANFDLSNLALQGVCPNNEILYDDKGMPSIMVKLQKMTYAELGMGESTAVHPAFIVNGQEVDYIWISKYQNIVYDNRAYSLPCQDPANTITFNNVLGYCSNKGPGWHLMTRMEWGFLVRWCQKNGYMPNGNNNFGKDGTESTYKALATSYSGARRYRTATGTGPLTWYHDKSPSGIADLCGNVIEYMGGIRIVYGELQILPNNDAADSSNSQGSYSSAWKAISAEDGSLLTPDGTGTTQHSVKVAMDESNHIYYTDTQGETRGSQLTSSFGGIYCDESVCDAAKLTLQNLCLLMYQSGELFSSHTNQIDNQNNERVFASGGSAGLGSNCRMASFAGAYPRGTGGKGEGFRAAYVELPSA